MRHRSWIAFALAMLAIALPYAAKSEELCATQSVKVRSGSVPLGSALVVRPKCRRGEVKVIDTSSFNGPAGAAGATGPEGPRGLQGVAGPTGPQGAVGGPIAWVEATSDSSMESNTGYIASGGGRRELSLPTNPSVGDVVEIMGGADLTEWRVVPGVAGQTIRGYEGLYTAGKRHWMGLAVSTNGSRLVGIVNDGFVYTSTDAGATWVERVSAGKRQWRGVATSDDGLRIAAFEYAGDQLIHTSSDGGASWVQRSGAGARGWLAIACSSDGLRLVAISNGDLNVHTSNDGGASWVHSSEPSLDGAWSMASSSDATRLAVAVNGGYVVTSNDGGATWVARTSLGTGTWTSVSISDDGMRLIAVNENVTFLVLSGDGGESWVSVSPVVLGSWQGVTMSSDGMVIFAADRGTKVVYRSLDGGVTWARFMKGDLGYPATDATGNVLYGVNRGGYSYLRSSSLNTFDGVTGDGHLRLLYLGSGVFGES